MEAQTAIRESALCIESTEGFSAEWTFDNNEDLYQSIFDYYNVPFNKNTALNIAELIDEKMESRPIVLQDSMVIQSLTKI